jgi:hypothetical protein
MRNRRKQGTARKLMPYPRGANNDAGNSAGISDNDKADNGEVAVDALKKV